MTEMGEDWGVPCTSFFCPEGVGSLGGRGPSRFVAGLLDATAQDGTYESLYLHHLAGTPQERARSLGGGSPPRRIDA